MPTPACFRFNAAGSGRAKLPLSRSELRDRFGSAGASPSRGPSHKPGRSFFRPTTPKRTKQRAGHLHEPTRRFPHVTGIWMNQRLCGEVRPVRDVWLTGGLPRMSEGNYLGTGAPFRWCNPDASISAIRQNPRLSWRRWWGRWFGWGRRTLSGVWVRRSLLRGS